MKKVLKIVIAVIIVCLMIILGLRNGIVLDETQKDTLHQLLFLCGISIAYCFIVGEISRNNSQMDKLWSILPIIYLWIIAYNSQFNFRVVIMAVLVSLWGIRLTYNFAKKGAYSIKFWSGEEDYRWKYLRSQKPFNKKIVWAIFDLFFISMYQNVLVLLICIPALSVMSSNASFGLFDLIASLVTVFFLIYETIADRQQRKFQTRKWDMINSGSKLEELDKPYNLGFNTVGLWSRSRHPNYLGEQGIWVGIYLFIVGALGIVFDYSILGSMLLILLFIGSSSLQESISSSKYPKYKDYQEKVFKYLPIKKYK